MNWRPDLAYGYDLAGDYGPEAEAWSDCAGCGVVQPETVYMDEGRWLCETCYPARQCPVCKIATIPSRDQPQRLECEMCGWIQTCKDHTLDAGV